MHRLHLHHSSSYIRTHPLHHFLLRIHPMYTSINPENYYSVNYPVDDTGKQCFYKQTDAPFIYFANINDLSSNRYCVSECPHNGRPLACSLNNQCSSIISTYDSQPVLNSLGGLC